MIKPKMAQEVARMRQAGRIVATALAEMQAILRPGLTTQAIDLVAETVIRRMGGIPSFKGYRGFPATVCVSVNEEIVHGIPSGRWLVEGDIISLDVGAIWDGYQADAAITVGIGKVSDTAQRLIDATKRALEAGIATARADMRLGDVSYAIESVAREAGFEVVREYGGHGIGKVMHEPLHIPNWGARGQGIRLKRGMTMALEPMLTAGGYATRQLADGWTVVTADGSLSAHFEHTIVVADGEAEILTKIS